MRHFKNWHLVIAAFAVVLTVAGVMVLSKNASAQTDPIRLELPRTAQDEQGNPRDIESNAMDVSEGITLRPNVPSGSPGSTNQPLPKFSGINAPYWISETGPAQVTDDLILWGLTDVKVGLINTGGAGGAASGARSSAIAVGPDVRVPNTPLFTTQGSDTPIGKFIINNSGATPIKITKFIFAKTGTLQDKYITKLTLLTGDIDSGAAIGETIGNFIITPSVIPNIYSEDPAHDFQILANISMDAPLGANFKLTLTGLELKDANNNPITMNIPSLPFDLQTVTLATSLRLATNSSTPAGSSVPQGTWTVDAAKINFYGYGGGFRVTGVTVTRSGTTAAADVPVINLVDPSSGIVLANNVAANNNKYEAIFSAPWTVGDGVTKNLLIRTDLSANATVGATFALGIENGSDVTIQSTTGDPNPNTGGNLPAMGNTFTISAAAQPSTTFSLTLATNTPAGGNVQQSTPNLLVTKINLAAPAATDVTVNNITVTRYGINAAIQQETSNIKLFDGSNLLGTVAALDASNKATFQSLGWTIPMGATKTLTIQTDVPATANINDVFGLGIASAAEITLANGQTASGSFPIAGNQFTVTSSAATISLARDTAPTTLGEGSNIPLLQFRASTGGGSTADVIRLYIKKEGTALNANFANFKLRKCTTGLLGLICTDIAGATAANIANVGTALLPRYAVNIPLSPAQNITSTASTYRLVGDVICGDATKTVDFILESQSDVFVSTVATPQGLPFAISLRNLPACSSPSPIPPPPLDEGTIKGIYNPDSAPTKRISLLGSLIPTAYAQAAGGATEIAAPINPVAVYDDLYIYGNSAEPGNLDVGNSFVVENSSELNGNLTVGGTVYFTGDELIVISDTNLDTLSVKNGATVFNSLTVTSGDLSITQGNLSLSGNLTATEGIGAFYRVEATQNTYNQTTTSPTSTTTYPNTMATALVACDSGDILISCSGELTTLAYSSYAYRFYGAVAEDTNCKARGVRSSSANSNPPPVKAQAVCFSPNGLPAGRTSIPTPP